MIQKKFLKYLFLFLPALIIIFVIVFGLSKIRNQEPLLSPVANIIFQKSSSFSLENAPTESLKGNIIKMTGDIRWQSRVATESSKISTPVAIQQGEKLGTGEKSSLSLVFPDACSVDFSENTEIEIIQTLPANLVFFQTSGIGEYNKTGSDPISIRTKNLLIEVDGDIVVSINPKKPVVTLTLKTGKAIVAYNDLRFISHEVILIPGKIYTFNEDTRKGVLK